MRNTLFANLFLTSVWLGTLGCGGGDQSANDIKGLKGKISISGAFALYPLAVQWGEEFRKIHPHVLFDIQGGGAGKGMTDVLSGSVEMGMVSRDISDEEFKKGAFPVAVAKDAVVATFNSNNPHRAEIEKTGMTRDELKAVWLDGRLKTWGEALGVSSGDRIDVYTRSDAAGAPETWAKFLGGHQEDLLGTGVFGDPGVAEVVSKTRLALGFNNLNYVYDNKSKKPFPGLRVLPLDLNANGTVDAEENFYDDIHELNRAIGENRFPSPPARELYFVTKGKTDNVLIKEFLNWALTEGQKFIPVSGYVPLNDSVLTAQKKKIE